MDKRDKNREREHKPHGWAMIKDTSSVFQPGMVLVNCPCGWLGWVHADIFKENSDES